MLDIYIDADACPVKEEVYRVAQRYGLRVFVVANSVLRVPPGDWVQAVLPASSAGSSLEPAPDSSPKISRAAEYVLMIAVLNDVTGEGKGAGIVGELKAPQ